MSLQRKSLVSFLNSAKTALNSAVQHSTPITFVVGNESADLDSLCSAVVFAYLRTYSGSKSIHVPLSNLPRADLDLRPELRPVLSRANIKIGDLVTLSDLPPSNQRVSALDPAKTRWILVDHNALQGELGKVYSGQVIGVIDHHDEENQVPKDCGDEPRVITKSGSCTSLVIEYCREAWDALSKSSTGETAAWDGELAHLALAPILIDTANLKDTSKVTPTDTEAVKYLECRIAASSVKYSRDDYFNEISTAKADIGQLSRFPKRAAVQRGCQHFQATWQHHKLQPLSLVCSPSSRGLPLRMGPTENLIPVAILQTPCPTVGPTFSCS